MTKIVIVGAGTGGLSVLRSLKRKLNNCDFTIIEPSKDHYYQPLWTLVGGGVSTLEESRKDMSRFIPQEVNWIQDKVETFNPEVNSLMTSKGTEVQYDYLVVAPGIQIDWHKIEGLQETLGKNGVCSNYSKDTVDYTWEVMKGLKSGRALFTFPNTPIKCAGAPQKVMYLAEETFRDNNVREKVEVKFVSAGGAIFGVPKYKEALEKVIKKRNINTLFKMNLVKVDGDKKIATFENIDTGERHEEEFDMIHVSPPMSAPDFIKSSPLANDQGWVDVDKNTTRHNRFSNIFSLGDASSMPNSKTGAAIREQAPVLVDHLVASIRNSQSNSSYDGYASCPLVTSRSTCIMAEFNYEGKPTESFPFNQAKERYSMYWMKKNGIPFIYWKGMMKGFFSPRDFFPENIGKFERIIRVAVGLVLVSLAFIGPKSPWFLLGAIPALTGILGWCPPYQLLGISTCRVKQAK